MSAGARLIWQRADGSSAEFELGRSPQTLGRDEAADIRVDEPLVSRNHARLELREGAWFVLDLGSTNLTRVNGQVVAERELKDRDELRFARARVLFRAAGSELPETARD